MATAPNAPKAPTKSIILANMAERTGLSKKDIGIFFDALAEEIKASIAGKNSAGQFTIPGLCKIVVVEKKALPKREVRNIRTGEMQWAAPRPASKAIKVRPLKGLKEMVS